MAVYTANHRLCTSQTLRGWGDRFQERWHLEDWQSFGVSYAKTLRAWKDNLDNWKGLEEFDLRFRRMWVPWALRFLGQI